MKQPSACSTSSSSFFGGGDDGIIIIIIITIIIISSSIITWGPGLRSRYSDSPRAGRSGNRIPVEARFSAPVQANPGAHRAICRMGTGSSPGVKRLIIIIIINIIIIIIIIVFFIQGIHTHIPETNHVPRGYTVAAILSLLFMVPLFLVPALALLFFYVITFRSMCAVPDMAVFCSSWTS